MHPPDPFANRYTNLRLVGRGGFGAVYRAWDPELDSEVAIKLLNPELATDPDWRRRFRQEATTARKLLHQNITIVYDRGEFQGHPFIVMEFVEGEPLSRIIEQRNPLTIPERLDLIEQLCEGLHYAHQRHIVHRDIKPVNLVVREEQDGRRLKILDFGIAKVVNAGQTSTGQMMFTPNYVSPEQIRGLEVDQRSDMFAVGAVAYELLVGKKAFAIKTTNPFAFLEEVKQKIVELPHRAMIDVDPHIDPELNDIVNRALEKVPEDRYRDLEEMRRRIEKVRERLAPDEPTVRISTKLQNEIKQARNLLEIDDPTGAIELLDRVLPTATSQEARLLVEPLLAKARERQTAKHNERRLRDEQAAREVVNKATAEFTEGNHHTAIQLLESFTPQPLVAQQLALLTRASSLIDTAERAVNEGIRSEREATLRDLKAFAPQTLVATVVGQLERRAAARRIEEENAAKEAEERRERQETARAAEAVRSARDSFRGGRYDAAIQSLERFDPPARVASDLAQLRTAAALIERLSNIVKTGSRQDRARALEELRAYPARLLIEPALETLTELDRTLRVKEEDEATTAAVGAARESFRGGQYDAAIQSLERFDPLARVATDLAQLRAAATAIQRVSSIVTSGRAQDRTRALDELGAFPDRFLIEPALEKLTDLDRTLRVREEDEAVKAVVGSARQSFRGGEYDAAIQSLERFDPQARVATGLAELRTAATVIHRISSIVTTAAPQDRTRALDELGAFPDRFLIEPALEKLADLDRTLRLREDQEAEALVASALEEFDVGDRQAAIELLETAKSSDARVAETLQKLRERHEALLAEERLAEEAAELKKRARALFVNGQHDDAIASLEAFERRDLVDSTLGDCRRAVLVISAATTAVETGTRDERERALASLTTFTPADLVAATVRGLQRIADERDAEDARVAEEAATQRAQTAIRAAREQFQRGVHNEAIVALESFDDRTRVANALERLRRAKQVIDETTETVGSGPADARMAALERLATFADATLVAGTLVGLRAIHEERRASEEDDRAAAELVTTARAQFDRGDRAGALARLHQFRPVHPAVTKAIAELRTDANRRERAEQDELDARRLIATARSTFKKGQRAEAIAALEARTDSPGVANALKELRQANNAILVVEQALQDRDAATRTAAIAELSRFEPADLVEAAADALRERARQRTLEEQALRADAAAAEALARKQFSAGEIDDAIQTLTSFRSPTLVAEALAELTALATKLEAARTSVSTAPAPAREAALSALARVEPHDLIAKVLTELRQLDHRRTLEEARAEAERQKKEAAELASHARQQFASGASSEAIKSLEAFQPAHLVQKPLAELQDAWHAIQAARQKFAGANQENRQSAIDELRGREHPELVAWAADELQRQHVEDLENERRARDRYQRELSEAREAIRAALAKRSVRSAERELLRAERLFPKEPDWAEFHGSIQDLKAVRKAERFTIQKALKYLRATPAVARIIVALAVLIVGGTMAWKTLGPSTTPSSADKKVNPPPPIDVSPEYKRQLADAQTAYNQQRVNDAIASALSIYKSAPQDVRSQAASLLGSIRDAAAKEAVDARTKAENASGTSESTYRDGVSKQQQADGLKNPEDTAAAVAGYAEATLMFNRAATTAWKPETLVAEATNQFKAGKIPQAIDYLQQVLRREPSYRPALSLLGEIRQQSQLRVRRAQEAFNGITPQTSTYKAAYAKLQDANRLVDAADSLRQFQAYSEAESLYRRAIAEEVSSLVVTATKEQDSGALIQAAGHAQQALQLNPADATSRDLLANIRRKAQQQAQQAKADLKGQGTGTTQFKDAETKIRNADQLTAVTEGTRQVRLYDEAEALYKAAGVEATRLVRLHADAIEHTRLAQVAIDRRDFAQADSEIAKALESDPGIDVSGLRKNIAAGRRVAANEATNQKIADLMNRAKNASDADAVALLTQALDLDSSRDDVRRELNRRKAPPPPKPSAEELAMSAVRQTIASYVTAYNSMNVQDVRRYRPSFKGYSRDLNATVLTVSNVSPQLSSDLKTANVTLTVRYRNTFAKGSVKEAMDTPTLTLTWRLEQTSNGWIILE